MPKSSRKSRKKSKDFITKIAKKIFGSQNTRTLFGLLFVILGLLFLYRVPVIESVPQNKEPIVASSEFKKLDRASNIVRILIPKDNIDLPVKHAKIVKGYWETSQDSASHGEGTANPGEKGNVVVFAHAREGFFYNLKDVQKDDVVYVMTQDKWYRYKISEIKTVYPNKIETVAPTKNEVLTLFTCSGFFDEKRLIVKALPAH